MVPTFPGGLTTEATAVSGDTWAHSWHSLSAALGGQEELSVRCR